MIILVILLYAILAVSFVLSKVILSYADPLTITYLRFFLASIIFLSIYGLFQSNKKTISWADTRLFAQYIVFPLYLSYVLVAWSMMYVPSVKASLYYNLTPFITGVLAYFWFGQVLSWKKILGMLVGFIGFLPYAIISGKIESASSVVFTPAPWLADIALLISVESYAYGWILMKELQLRGYQFARVNGIGMLVAGLLVFLTIPLTGAATMVIDMKRFLILLIAITLISNIVYVTLYSVLLRTFRPTFLSFMGTITPLFSALLGWSFLDEQLNWAFWVALSFISIGLYLFYQEELQFEGLRM